MRIKFKVVSDSMIPALRVGDELEIGPVPLEPRPFDILLFKRSESLFVHFVWRFQKSKQTVITRSLKNPFHDEEPVYLEEVVGKIEGVRVSPFQRWKILGLNFLRGTY